MTFSTALFLEDGAANKNLTVDELELLIDGSFIPMQLNGYIVLKDHDADPWVAFTNERKSTGRCRPIQVESTKMRHFYIYLPLTALSTQIRHELNRRFTEKGWTCSFNQVEAKQYTAKLSFPYQ